MYQTFALGILVSMIFTEITGFYPGGIIVPVWLSFYVDQPYRIISTLVISLICLLIYKLFRKYLFLYGKRRFVMLILISTLLSFILKQTTMFTGIKPVEIETIGWIIPGLIANSMEKQGILVSIISTLAVTITIKLFVVWLL